MITTLMVADTASLVIASTGLGLIRGYQFSIAAAADQISALIQPCDAVALPPVKPGTYKLPRRTLLRRKRRTKRRLSGDDSGNDAFFFGDGRDGPFGGGGFGGGGGGGGDWNFNGFGDGHNWDEPSPSLQDPAFDFVYQMERLLILIEKRFQPDSLRFADFVSLSSILNSMLFGWLGRHFTSIALF